MAGAGLISAASKIFPREFRAADSSSSATQAARRAGRKLAGFVQDDWRLSQKFTLNLGLRYSYDSPLRENHNLWANFDPTSPTGLVQQGQGGLNTLWHPDRGDFSPRVGFAWDLNGKGTTVVRGGFSVIYSTFTMIEWMTQNQFQQPGGSSVSLGANPSGAFHKRGGSRKQGYSAAFPAESRSRLPICWSVNSAGMARALCFRRPRATCNAVDLRPQCNLMGVDPNLKTPYVMNFSLGITHAFANNLSLEVSYVGNHGARLTGFTDINQCPANVHGRYCVLPYASKFPWFGYINEMTNDVRSNYNSMQATLTKRMSHGLVFHRRVHVRSRPRQRFPESFRPPPAELQRSRSGVWQ